MQDRNNEPLVIKANKLIQDYKYSLSKTEMRVLNFIISKIQSPKYDRELNIITFDIMEFYKMLGQDPGGNNYKTVKDILRNLSNNSTDYIDFGEYQTIVRWIERPIFHKNSGTVDIKLDDFLKDYLLSTSGVISAKLRYYFLLNSKYSIRLYELLKSWDGTKSHVFELEDFKASIDARTPSYENYGKLKQSVLEPAIKEINEYTDLEISYTPIKRGRKVVELEFTIKKVKSKDDEYWGLPIDEEKPHTDDELNEQQEKFIREVNRTAFSELFQLLDAEELVKVGSFMAELNVSEGSKNILELENEDKIAYYREKFNDMNHRYENKKIDNPFQYLRTVFLNEKLDFLGIEPAETEGKYKFKNPGKNTAGIEYDLETIENFYMKFKPNYENWAEKINQ